MIKAGISIVVLVILQSLWPAISDAADPASPQFNEELSKQENIYQSKGEQRPEGYVIDRSLVSYTHTLSPAFDRVLADLGPQDRWLDIGAGRGQAVLDYYGSRYDMMHPEGQERRGKKAKAIAMSIEDRRTFLWDQTATGLAADQIRYVFGRRLREYSSEELGQFQVITDVIGGFSYTTNLSLFMEKVMGLLVMNGSFFTVLQDVHAEDGRNKPYYEGARFLTEIANADSSELSVCSWLKRIACAEVTCEFKTGWKPPIEVYQVRKVCNNVTVPDLAPTHFEAGTPPERGFKLKN